MRRSILLAACCLVLSAPPASADPGVSTLFRDGVLRVTLDGSYAGSAYRAFRAGAAAGEFAPLASDFTLCTGECYVFDATVAPGQTYYYRFEVQSNAAGTQTFGPYAVAVPDTPLEVRVTPNPSRGPTTLTLSLPGSPRRDGPLDVQARVLDVQGRLLRVLHAGPLARGTTSLEWDGRDASGRVATPGLYFVRLATPIGGRTVRLVRVH